MACLLAPATILVLIEPQAGGSGIPEIIAYVFPSSLSSLSWLSLLSSMSSISSLSFFSSHFPPTRPPTYPPAHPHSLARPSTHPPALPHSSTQPHGSYLNGIVAPRSFDGWTVAIKMVGTVLAVSSGLAIGPEGPTIHLGAAVTLNVVWCVDQGIWRSRHTDPITRHSSCSSSRIAVY
jgi:hypothetical protein